MNFFLLLAQVSRRRVEKGKKKLQWKTIAEKTSSDSYQFGLSQISRTKSKESRENFYQWHFFKLIKLKSPRLKKNFKIEKLKWENMFTEDEAKSQLNGSTLKTQLTHYSMNFNFY